MFFISNKQGTRSCVQLTAHFKNLKWSKVRGLFRGENGIAWILVSLWWRGKHSRRFSHHQRTQAGSENKMQEEVTLPGCSERPWQCLFLLTVTEVPLNILTINSGLGLISSASFSCHFFFCLPVFQGTSLLFCWKTSPQKAQAKRAQRQQRGGEQRSSLPALQLGWDPKHSRAGGRARDADKEL